MKGRVLAILLIALPLLAQENDRPYERCGWCRRDAPLVAWTEGDAPDIPRPRPVKSESAPPPTANVPGPAPAPAPPATELFERVGGFDRRWKPRRAWTDGEKPPE